MGGGPFSHILTLVHHYNEGLIANLPVPLPLILLVTFIVLVLVGWMLALAIRDRRTHAAVGLALLIGGALGNVWDRLTIGAVFDWILLADTSAINVADLCILGGVLLYVRGARRAPADLPPI